MIMRQYIIIDGDSEIVVTDYTMRRAAERYILEYDKDTPITFTILGENDWEASVVEVPGMDHMIITFEVKDGDN